MGAVLQFERERLLDGVLEELAEKGQGNVEVAAAMRRVGLDDNEWLVRYPDVESCLFAAYDQLIERLMRAVYQACSADDEWPLRVGRGLAALLEAVAAQPWVGRVLTRTFPAIGPKAYTRYQEFVEGFAPLLAGGRELCDAGVELPADVELLAVGAGEAIVVDEIEAGRAAGLPRLGPEILYSVLVPFLGPDQAAAEMQRAAEGLDDLEVA